MSELKSTCFRVLQDNYGYLLHDAEVGRHRRRRHAGCRRDRGAARRQGWRLTHILNTHHHSDHAGGNLALKERTGCQIVGPRADAARIPGIDVQVGDGDSFALGAHRVEVFDTPGHTRGHIVYWLRRKTTCGVRRRHAVRDGLRPTVRRHAAADVELAAEDLELAGRHAAVLRARVHAERTAFRADRRAAAIARSWSARRRWRGCARQGEPTVPTTRGAREGDQSVSCAREPASASDDRARSDAAEVDGLREDARAQGRVLGRVLSEYGARER